MITIEENYRLNSYNTFGLAIKARFFAEADQPEDLQTVVNVFRSYTQPWLILGGGSNILFTRDFDGVVIYPSIKGREVIKQTAEEIHIRAFAGENWDEFVAFCVSQGWNGIENLSLIPGNVGACPIQNIGAYGTEVKDVIDSVETIDLKTCSTRVFSNEECHFGYRDSIFKHEVKNKYLITSVTFKLSKMPVFKTGYKDVTEELKKFPEVNGRTIRNAVINIRERKLPDPKQLGNAGSFFKNPVIPMELFKKIQSDHPNIPSYPAGEQFVKISAAWLIEVCGWKGKRIGNVGSCVTQPLVIVNYGGAAGDEIFAFAREIQKSVMAGFGIELEMEVSIV